MNNNELKPNKIKEQIHYKEFNNQHYQIRFSDLPKDIQENDIIEIIKEDPFNSENETYDAYTALIIYRERDETHEELQKRTLKDTLLKEKLKARRYESYLKLKKEFESS